MPPKKPVKRKIVFNKKRAKQYDGWFKSKYGAFSDSLQRKAVFSMIFVKKGMPVLDIGCGTGRYSVELASKGGIVTGVDPAPEMLKIAKQRAKQAKTSVLFKNATAEKLPFKPNSFELVVGINVLELASNPEKAVKDALRVLKPGGRLVFGALNKKSLTALQRRMKGKFKESIYNNARFFSARDLAKMLSRNGVINIEWKTVGHLPESKKGIFVNRAKAIEKAGQRLFPSFGNFIVITGTKKGN